ncbi:MAG: GLPGLI family protein [Muribaculaceae bacterium]|nr:GLPGLI family protein [Muribaculaceae bacterium]
MKRILIYLFLTSVAIVANADNWVRDTEPAILEVHYTRTEVTDTTERETSFFNEETMLRIGKGMSRYCSVQRFNRDSLMYCAPDLYWQMEKASFEKDPKEHDRTSLERSGRYWCFIYKNYPEGKITETAYFDMEDWQYDEEWEKPEWEITDETKEIIGYQCFKAIADYRGRKWTAWFTPEIPIQDGPWKLCGLPGLILEAEDNHGEYHFLANGLKQNGITDVGFLCYREKRGVRKVSRDQFFNNWWRYKHSNFGAKMRAAFGVGPKPKPDDNKPKVLHHDKEETNYPHDL